MAGTPHFSLPFRLITQPDGKLAVAVTEQDTIEEIYDCVEAVTRYEKGYRPEKPDFGIVDHTFAAGPVTTRDIMFDVQEQEPRAEVRITSNIDSIDQLLNHMTVKISDNIGGDAND